MIDDTLQGQSFTHTSGRIMGSMENFDSQSAALAGRRRHRRENWAYLFILPVMLALSAFTFYPFLRGIYLTLFVTDKIGNTAKFVGFSNYERIWKSGALMESMGDTLKYALAICAGTFLLALVLAYLCVDKKKGSRIYQTMYSMPLAIATAPIAAVGTYIFGKYGMLNGLLGTNVTWLGNEHTKFICLVILVCWCNCGSSFIYLLVGFRNVPDELIECANIDGANAFVKFFKIYLPIASPQVFYVIFLNILTAFKSFTMIKMLFNSTNEPGLRVLNSQIYQMGFVQNRFETACIYALALCLLIFLVTRIQFILEKRMVHYQ